MTVSKTDEYIIWTGVVVFSIFGLFGNFHVIYAHYRLKSLRTKYGGRSNALLRLSSGTLLTMLVSAQSICLIFELVGLAYNISGLPLIRHRAFRRRTYLTVLIVPGIVYGIVVLTIGVLHTDSEQIKLCQPPSSLPFETRKIWYFLGLVFNVITIVSYVAAFSIIYCKYRNPHISKWQLAGSDIERKAMKSLSVIIIVFIFERLLLIFLMNILELAGLSKELIERAQAYMVFSAMTCYSSTFYVCFLRSSEYRKIFWSQIVGMFGCCGVKLKEDRFGTSTSENLRKNCSRISKFQPDRSYGATPRESISRF